MGLWHVETQRYLGSVGLHPCEPDGWAIPAFSIGYWIRVSEQGHGYVTEAVRLLTRYVFDVLHAQRIEIVCDGRNTRSIHVAEQVGFVQEGGYAMSGVLRMERLPMKSYMRLSLLTSDNGSRTACESSKGRSNSTL